ncbi:glycosyltransferase [Methylocaldum sp.]|uniref:glycosyltransferase n=1 Tax=Methylocaldum sp. TaxID=1969727 RepID=UPI002D412CCA|nr:glycosyltransferase [Methylocaldum sp.]HYE37945.1 glycosyltransferase [Methylocaldum sp.]
MAIKRPISMMDADASMPRVLVFTTVFPHTGQPNVGLFVQERMFRVGRRVPLIVVAPIPWFPFQGLLRKWRPYFRPEAPEFEIQNEFHVYHPKFFSIPGLLKSWDGFFMALGSYPTLCRLRRDFGFNLIDAHFAYPDGYAATLLGQWFKIPVTITLRGTEVPLAKYSGRRKRLVKALRNASHVFSVSRALKEHAVRLGAKSEKISVVGNGVALSKFEPVDRFEARRQLGVSPQARVLITVGSLVPRKGFHRVIELLPNLVEKYPDLIYLIVGGPGPEGDIGDTLKALVVQLNLEQHVRFLGAMPPERLKWLLSAADLFVLATSNEGWANVFLEAMACGLPVVTTDVGGNREVVCRDELGFTVPFGDPVALLDALHRALAQPWEKAPILNYAAENEWEQRVDILIEEYLKILNPDMRN